MRINTLKSRVLQAVLNGINAIEPSKISIPLGTVLGIDVLLDRGPRIHVRIASVSVLEADTRNEFTAAGINQTHHRVLLNVKAEVNIILSRKQVATEVSSRVLVAETVIVGQVPSAFTYVVGDKSDTIGIIDDYQMH